MVVALAPIVGLLLAVAAAIDVVGFSSGAASAGARELGQPDPPGRP